MSMVGSFLEHLAEPIAEENTTSASINWSADSNDNDDDVEMIIIESDDEANDGDGVSTKEPDVNEVDFTRPPPGDL